jgi:hypothetical protein
VETAPSETPSTTFTFLAGAEYVASYNLGNDVPYVTYRGGRLAAWTAALLCYTALREVTIAMRKQSTRERWWRPFVIVLVIVGGCRNDTDRIVRRHVEWLGGAAALAQVSSLRKSGRLVGSGLEGSIAVRETRAGWRRQEIDLGVISETEVVGPRGAWVRNVSGQVERLSSAAEEGNRRALARAFRRHLLEDVGARVTDKGSEERDGRSWRVVRWTYADGDTFDLFLDGKTGGCTWLRTLDDLEVSWTRLGDWRMVAGVRLPFEEKTFHDDPTQNQTIRWLTVQGNQAWGEAEFAPPEPHGVKVQFAAGASSTPWMNVDLAEGRWTYLSATVGGRETPALLDSGAQTTLMSPALADKLGLAVNGRESLRGTSGSQQAGFARGLSIEVGPLRLTNLTAVVSDMSGLEKAMGRPTPIVLGKEVFNAVVVDLDYPRSRIAFHDPTSYHPPTDAHASALKSGASYALPLSIEGLPEAEFDLDTGMGEALVVLDDYSKKHHLLDGRSPRSERLSRGVTGGATSTLATLRNVSVAGLDLKSVPVEFHPSSTGAFHTKRRAGLVGVGLLERFRLIVDFPHLRLYFCPAAGWQEKPFRKNHTGLQVDLRGQDLEVQFVAPGSPAEGAGWKKGQSIRAIDGKTIGPDYLTTQSDWIYRPPGSTVTLTDSDGVVRTLTLAEYY